MTGGGETRRTPMAIHMRGKAYLRAGALLVLSGVVLSACDNPRRALGLEKQAPDEFQVVSRAPLNLPPDFALRPPAPGAERPSIETTRETARNAVFQLTPDDTPGVLPVPATSAERSVVSVTTDGEQALLARAGVASAEADIRRVVDGEADVLSDSDSTFLDRLLSFRDADEVIGAVVDPEAEARRLRENDALGLPVTTGETPKIERKRRGLLEGIF